MRPNRRQSSTAPQMQILNEVNHSELLIELNSVTVLLPLNLVLQLF